MKIREILYTSHFKRALKRVPKALLPLVIERERMFRADSFDPRLKTHKLKGKLKKLWSFSITYSHRILFDFIGKETVSFIDVDDHDIYQ